MQQYLVQHYLSNSTREHMGKTSVQSPVLAMSWEHVHSLSNRVANALISSGVRRQDRVVLSLKRSPMCIVGMMGIVKADAIYVPIDSKAPRERWEKMLADSRPRAVVCDRQTITLANEVAASLQLGVCLVVLEEGEELGEKWVSGDGAFCRGDRIG